MAHNVETMAYAGEVPWHGLGTKVADNLAPLEMRRAAQLDWVVEEQPIKTSEGLLIPDKKALVRSSDNTVLDIVGIHWKPCQNAEAFEFFYDFCKTGGMQMHTAGSLQNGKIVWVLAKVNEKFELFGGDQVDSYLLFSNPHKFGHSINVRFTPIRVVCNNTLTLSLDTKSQNAVKLNHRSEFDADEVKHLMGLANVKFYAYKETAEALGKKNYEEAEVFEYLNDLFPPYSHPDSFIEEAKSRPLQLHELSNPSKRVHELIETSPGHEHRPGSWWNVFNAVTYFTDHERGLNADSRLTSVWYGQSKNLKLKALKKALEYSKAA